MPDAPSQPEVVAAAAPISAGKTRGVAPWFFWPLIVIAGGLTLAAYAALLHHEVTLKQMRDHLRLRLEPVRGALAREMFAAFYLTEGIASEVAVEGDIRADKFHALAAELMRRNELVRNVALAPGNVVRLVHPPAGNESVLGLDYARSPEQWPGVERMMATRQLVVAGPLKLVQGGMGVIGRRPIYVRSGDGTDTVYWGLVSTVVELDRLLAHTPLAELEAEFEVALRGRDGLGAGGPVFHGSPQVFARLPVVVEVPLPAGTWQLGAEPRGGWPRGRMWTSPVFLTGGALSLVLGALLGLVFRAQGAVHQSEALFRTLTEESLEGVYLIQGGRFVYVNPATAAMLGRSREELLAAPSALDCVEPEDRPRVAENLARRFRGEVHAVRQQFWIQRPDGERRLVETQGCVTRYRTHPAVLGTARDITDRYDAERRLARLNRTYAVLSDINQLIVRSLDPTAILEGACRVATTTGGFRLAWVGWAEGPTGPLRITAHAGATPDTLAILETLCRAPDLGCTFTARALAGGQPAICNDVARDPEAEPWRALALERGYRALISLPLRRAGHTVGVFNLYAAEPGFFDAEELKLLHELAVDLGFALDSCERERQRREAETALHASRELFRELAETIEDVFWIREVATNRLLYLSPAFERIWGRPPADLYAGVAHSLDAVHPEDRPAVRAALEQLERGGDYDQEYRILRPDGQVRWIRDRAFPVRTPEGQIVRLVGVARDVTERRQLEEQLRQSQKMEAIGLLAGGVAHDFNNILAVVQLQAELTAALPNLPPRVQEGLGQIRAATERAASLTRQLLLFGRRQVLQPRVLNLNQALTSLARMLRRVIGEDIALELLLADRPLYVRADPSMVDQVLLNLAVNARDAMPRGGRLLIETGEAILEADQACPQLGRAPGRYVWMRVRDTGRGIVPEVLPHIFEPFFTTKEVGKGTGLGLATVYSIVQQHHGWIEVHSTPGEGATFTIHLPAAAPEEVPGAAPAPAATPPPRGSETILLVEDDPNVRELTQALLAQSGYRVLSAADGWTALALWQNHRESVDLLLTDLVIPGGWSGRDLARRFREDKPGLKVLYFSGYSAEVAGRELDLQDDQQFLSKPFTAAVLLQTVRRLLDA